MPEFGAARTIEAMMLEKNQLEYLRSLVRMDIRHILKGALVLSKKYGADYNSARLDARMEFARQVYRDLGGDPDSITVVTPAAPRPA
jgi:hypothetical protein